MRTIIEVDEQLEKVNGKIKSVETYGTGYEELDEIKAQLLTELSSEVNALEKEKTDIDRRLRLEELYKRAGKEPPPIQE